MIMKKSNIINTIKEKELQEALERELDTINTLLNKHDKDIVEQDKAQLLHTFEVVEHPKGKTVQSLITDVVKVMREYSNF